MNLFRCPSSFKGYSWTELLECWNIPINSDGNTSTDIEWYNRQGLGAVRDRLHDAMKLPTKPLLLESSARDVRAFIQALRREEPGFNGPLWTGLLKIRDDYTLLQAVYELLPIMWT